MLVGEIGIGRREYLYDMTFCEILLTTRGYFRRYHSQWEMTRIIAYQIHFCMGLKEGTTAPSLQEFMTFPWERTADGDTPIDLPTEADIEDLRRIMREENARMEAEEAAKADS